MVKIKEQSRVGKRKIAWFFGAISGFFQEKLKICDFSTADT